MTVEKIEEQIKKGTNILSRWANCEGINATDATKELMDSGFGFGLINTLFDIAVDSEGYAYIIERKLREFLSSF